MRLPGGLAIASLTVPALLSAGSHAYIVASGIGNPTTPGAITPFDTAKGEFGAPYFVPPGGNLMAVAPGTKQIWQATTAPFCDGTCGGPFAINVLDPKTGSTLATIPLSYQAFALVFDSAGQYAYVSMGYEDPIYLAKIDVSTRTILSVSNVCGGAEAFSSDGSKLFVSGYCGSSAISVVDPETLAVVGSIAGVSGPMFISGRTLLIISQNQLLYFNTNTLQQSNAVTLAAGSYLFAVSPDGSKIYLYIPCNLCTSTIQILDFATGRVLLSQTYSNQILSPLLSRDGRQITVAASQVSLVDAQTLAIIKTVASLGNPWGGAVCLGNDTVLMLYPDTGAMMVVDQSSAQVTATFPLGMTTVAGEVADPAHALVFTGSDDTYCINCPKLNAVSAKLNRIVQNFSVEFVPIAVAGSQLYGAGGLGSKPSVYNLSTGVLATLPAPKLPGINYHANASPGAITPDGKMYWVPYVITNPYYHLLDSLVAIYDTASKQISGHFAVPLPGAGPIVISGDSSTAYIGGTSTIAVYDTTTLQQTATYSYATTFTSLVISPDGSTLYGTDGTAVYVLDTATGALQQTYTLPSPVNGTMALSPDGTVLFLTDAKTSSVDMVQTANGAITVVPLPYTPTRVVVLP